MNTLVALVQFRNELAQLPDFFANISPQIDGIIGIDDGSIDGSGGFFSKHPKVLAVINKATRSPHIWDEPLNKMLLIEVCRKFNPGWVIAIDVDERLEKNFRKRASTWIVIANFLKLNIISLQLFEAWGNPHTVRVDGIWGRKKRRRLFRFTQNHETSSKEFHGPWFSVADSYNQRTLSSNLLIYHLGMIDSRARYERQAKYKTLDPECIHQTIGYDYLTCEKNLKTKAIQADRHYQSDDHYGNKNNIRNFIAQKLIVLTCKKIKKLLNTHIEINGIYPSDNLSKKITAAFNPLRLVSRASKSPSLIISGWHRVGKTTLARHISDKFSLLYVSFDYFSRIYQEIPDDNLRIFIKQSVINALVNILRQGVVIEGDDFVYNNFFRSHQRPNPSISTLKDLKTNHGLNCFIVGTTSNFEKKFSIIKNEKKCAKSWIYNAKGWEIDQLIHRTEEILSSSQKLKLECNKYSIQFLEIDAEEFTKSLQLASAKIEAQLLSPFSYFFEESPKYYSYHEHTGLMEIYPSMNIEKLSS